MLASSIDTELFWAFRIEGRKPCRQKWRVNWLKISLEIFNFDKANVYQKGSFNGLICAFVKYARFFYLVYCGSLRPPPCSLLKYFKYFKCIVHCWRMYCTLLKNVCSIWRFQMHCTLLKNVCSIWRLHLNVSEQLTFIYAATFFYEWNQNICWKQCLGTKFTIPKFYFLSSLSKQANKMNKGSQ